MEANAEDNDTQNICFVCGFNRSEFSKRSANFKKHISKEHDPWKYIFYMVYMSAKGLDELSGLEYFAWTKSLKGNTDFVPIGSTLFLQDGDSSEGSLDDLNKKILGIADYVEDQFKDLANYLEKSAIIKAPLQGRRGTVYD